MRSASKLRGCLRKLTIIILIIAILVYVVVAALLYIGQRGIIYQPYLQSFAQLSSHAAEEGFIPWTNSAGKLAGWKKISRNPFAPQLLILHGNGGNATSVLYGVAGLLKNGDWNVYSMEYPGYGDTPGSPTEQGIYLAGRDAVENLKAGGPLHVMGISLGTGVATYLAAAYHNDIRGVLLVAPYDNLASVASIRMPLFPVRWMLKDRFASDEHLRDYHGPVAMIFAGRDTVVPNRLGHRLYDGYNGPKKSWQVEHAGHNDLLEQPGEWWAELLNFWASNSISK